MRILHVLPSLDQMYGGPLRAVVDLSFESGAYGLESEIVGFGEFNLPDCPLPRDVFHAFPVHGPQAIRYSRQFSPWLDANLRRFDGVVIHGMWQYPSWAIHQSCRKTGTRYVCFPHGMLDHWSVNRQGPLKRLKKTAYWYLRERKVFSDALCVFYTTQREKILSSVTFAKTNEERVVIPYGISTKSATIKAPSNPELIIPSGRKTALFLGRVHPKKNPEFLIRAWCQAATPNNWQLIIAGPADPVYLSKLKRLAGRSHRGKTIRFVGAVSGDDKTYLLQQASWFLLPSSQENFGVAVLEAISNNCPVAISPGVYLADEMHSESEILPLDERAWVEFFEQRMVDQEWHSRLCGLDAELLKPKFQIEKIAKAWADTLGSIFVPDNQGKELLRSSVASNAS